jgi:hypothetical protein
VQEWNNSGPVGVAQEAGTVSADHGASAPQRLAGSSATATDEQAADVLSAITASWHDGVAGDAVDGGSSGGGGDDDDDDDDDGDDDGMYEDGDGHGAAMCFLDTRNLGPGVLQQLVLELPWAGSGRSDGSGGA